MVEHKVQYTAISFAPVQGFIEKSRKLRDLFGASLILSHLSQKIAEELHDPPNFEVISPALIERPKGMANRILVKGGLIERSHVQNILLKHWQHLLWVCRQWVEKHVPAEYHWAQKTEQISKEKGEWERWGSYTWEVFWGAGDCPKSAMDDLETRKLKRAWIGVNWLGDSSSLSGTDAIAWPQLGLKHEPGEYQPGHPLTSAEQEAQELFYRRLSWLLDAPDARIGRPHLSLSELKAYEKDSTGKYIAVNERLSVLELVKRLVTYDNLDADLDSNDRLNLEKLKANRGDPEFKDIYREAGYWTGWFMGDGDKVGDTLKYLSERYLDDPAKRDRALNQFAEQMRCWGFAFSEKQDLFPGGKGRVIYAGGDDFLGVLYSAESQTADPPEKVKPSEAWTWLLTLPKQWEDLQKNLNASLSIELTYSVGFVWAGHQVPQRDVLQHCRDAEKQAKQKGRDRVTIRVLFNSGQYVQWTCPWGHLGILSKYRDRDHQRSFENNVIVLEEDSKRSENWNHLYSDWAALKARHAITLKALEGTALNTTIAMSIFNFYFQDAAKEFQKEQLWEHLAGDSSPAAIVNWMDDLIQVGWQLCRNLDP